MEQHNPRTLNKDVFTVVLFNSKIHCTMSSVNRIETDREIVFRISAAIRIYSLMDSAHFAIDCYNWSLYHRMDNNL